MSEPGAFEEIPATTINAISDFSPIKFTEKSEQVKELKDEENLFRISTATATATVESIVDEEITFMARKTDNFKPVSREDLIKEPVTKEETLINFGHEERLQRKSDEDICNTPKRERHEDQKLNIRSARLLEMDQEKSETILKAENQVDSNDDILMKTPKKKGEIVKSLSIEFEQRLASIHVSPRPATIGAPGTNHLNNNMTTTSATNNIETITITTPTINTATNSTTGSPTLNISASKPVRSMSPIRSIAQLSPVSKLNLNDETITTSGENFIPIETPKLVSPSKIAAAGSAVDIEKIKNEIESKWAKQVEFLQFEVSTLQEKYETSIKGNSEMRTMLAEYEKTLAQFIDARRTKPDQHSSIDQLVQDKKKLELEIQTLQISYQNLHQRYEDLKGLQEQSRINDATLRQSIQLLQQELASTVRTLENTRRAYEDKIEKLNTDAKNTKETLEYELSATKAKLLKSELKISSLESAIETKTKENSELMTICDELIHKMDKRCP